MEKFTEILNVIWSFLKKLWGYIKMGNRFIRYWTGRFKTNVIQFYNHPVQFVKDYIQDFKAASTKEKIIKLILTAAGIYALCVMTMAVVTIVAFVLCFFVLSIFFGSGSSDSDWEFARYLYMERHDGREPRGWFDVYE